MLLRTKLFGKTYEFPDLRVLMGKANEEKSGDRLAGLAAADAQERAAAKLVLAEVPLWALRACPAVPYDQDEVTRVIQDGLNETVYGAVKDLTVGELRERILDDRQDGADLALLGSGLTSEMVAAVTKLMSNMDLAYAASRIRVRRHAANTIGLERRLSGRLQPNHPTDSPEGIRAEIFEGLAYGCGDAVIGINPSDDSYASVARLLDMTYGVVRTWEIPTQTCVLAHVTTQMRCLQSGSPVGLVFQSICGSQRGNESFGISVGMLDEAYALARKHCYPAGPDFMYFETGQGSALSADAHNGWDQLTLEARNYGPGPALLAHAGEHRGGLHRPRVPVRHRPDPPGRARGPLHGQALGRVHGLRRVLHQPRRHRPEQLREPGHPAGRRRLQLHHGRAHGRRFHALLPVHLLP